MFRGFNLLPGAIPKKSRDLNCRNFSLQDKKKKKETYLKLR